MSIRGINMVNNIKLTDDSRHGKTDLKVFVVVIPKEGAHSSFGMTSTFQNLTLLTS